MENRNGQAESSFLRGLLRLSAVILFLLLIYVILFNGIFGIVEVEGFSMQDTLHHGDILFFKRNISDYQAGDVVVARMGSGDLYVKRIVAVEGDVVNIENGCLYVNGIREDNPHAKGSTYAFIGGEEFPYTVPAGRVFLAGDNREHSEDSRIFGALPLASLQGRLFVE